MKRYMFFWGGIVLLILLSIMTIGIKVARSNGSNLSDLDTGLYVDGQSVPCKIIYNNEQGYAEVPILAILKALRYHVNEIEENTFELEKGEKRFLIDTATGVVIDEDDPRLEDMIITTPGATFYYKMARDGDIYVDQQSMRTLFLFMGIRANIWVNFDLKTVTVSSLRD